MQTPKPIKVDSKKRRITNPSQKAHWWRVDLGLQITGGKRIRRFFDSEGEARKWIAQKTKEREEKGKAAFNLNDNIRVEAMECLQRLKPIGVSLTEAVDYYLRYALPAGGQKTFADVADEFIKSRIAIGCKEKTMTQYVSYIEILKTEWGNEFIHQIKRADIEDWISETDWAPRTKKNYLVTLTTIFNFAIGREYCVDNPAFKVERPILDDTPIGILTPEEAKNLLDAALKYEPCLVVPIAIGLFAGLRRSEICSLDWKEINLSSGYIEVKGAKAKTRKRRLVTISENLKTWIEPYAKESGDVAPSVDAFGERLKHLVKGRPKTATEEARPTIKDPWPHNAIRHSFGSYFYAKTKNENTTASEMGNSPQMVFQHYRELVNPSKVHEYWIINNKLNDKMHA